MEHTQKVPRLLFHYLVQEDDYVQLPWFSVADPDLELKGGGGGGGGGGGLDLIALSAIFPSVISSFFTQNKGGLGPRAPPLDPPLIPMQ